MLPSRSRCAATILFISCIFKWLSLGQVDYSCDDAYSCYGSTISQTDASVSCRGYFSCSEASITQHNVNITDAMDVTCSGAYSCYQSSITMLYSKMVREGGLLDCGGQYSCANASLRHQIFVTQPTSGISCSGQLSCYNSQTYTRSVSCDGELSCAHSVIHNIKGNSSATFFGYLSGYNSTIIANGSGVMEVSFWAPYSGDYATVICHPTATQCIIACSFNACNKLTLICEGRNNYTECNFQINCDSDAQRSTLCPHGVDFPERLLIETDSNDYYNETIKYTMQNGSLNNNNGFCNSSTIVSKHDSGNVVTCRDYQECATNRSLYMNNVYARICCAADSGCATLPNITSIINTTTGPFDATIRCDGELSCSQVSSLIETKNVGNIYMTGLDAAMNTKVISLSQSTASGNVYCQGSFSCGGTHQEQMLTIEGGNNLYCAASVSCVSTTITGFASNLYLYGFGAALEARILNTGNSIYCFEEACASTVIDQVNNSVYMFGTYSAFGTTMSNIKGSIWGMDFRSLGKSLISNSSQLVCWGNISCWLSVIKNVSYIHAHGKNSLNNATIMSDLGSTSSISINCSMNQTYDIYCNASSICHIYCLQSGACITQRLHCAGQCFVDCDPPKMIECPTVVTGNYTRINETRLPTHYPTISPTFHSTYQPSTAPTTVPTASPQATNHDHKDKTQMIKDWIIKLAPWVVPAMLSVGAALCVCIHNKRQGVDNRNINEANAPLINDDNVNEAKCNVHHKESYTFHPCVHDTLAINDADLDQTIGYDYSNGMDDIPSISGNDNNIVDGPIRVGGI